MRHVPIAEFKDKLSEIVAAAETGEEVAITRHGRPVVRLVAIEDDRMAKQREAVRRLSAAGREIRARHGPTTPEEICAWINEDRR